MDFTLDGEQTALRDAVRGLLKGYDTEHRREVVAQEHDLRVWAVVLLAPGSLPKTSSGKLQRSLCRDRYLGAELAVS